jgi:hypothetical protein
MRVAFRFFADHVPARGGETALSPQRTSADETRAREGGPRGKRHFPREVRLVPEA